MTDWRPHSPGTPRCESCQEYLTETEAAHVEEHPDLCCDCFDLSLGMPLKTLNAERATKGRNPLGPWKGAR